MMKMIDSIRYGFRSGNKLRKNIESEILRNRIIKIIGIMK